ncbi:S8 family serine peptidase [bacterium]|nr:S8 family serine peptidase [bacterium]
MQNADMFNRNATTFKLFRAALFVALFLSPTLTMSAQRSGPVPGRFIIKLQPRVDAATVAQSLDDQTVFRQLTPGAALKTTAASELDRYYLYVTPDTTARSTDAIAAIGADRIAHIEPDYYLELFDLPSDGLFSNQWGLYNDGQGYLGIVRLPGVGDDTLALKSGIAGKDMNLRPFYQSPPSETTSVVVGVIDSGTDLHHPELAGRLFHNEDEIPGNGLDDDHNGFIDDTLGFDMSGDIETITDIVPDNDPTDEHGHGTHIAGIVAANNDAQGVVGVAPWVKILPVKILPNATTAVGVSGIIYAVNAGAKILNLSWGSPYESLLLQEAIAYARSNGVIVMAASGNSGQREFFYPANTPGSFTVGAGNSSGDVTYFSTYGEHIDLIAPGEDILSLRAAGTDMYAGLGEPGVRIVGPDSLYYLSDGTSMATPMAVGAAALLWSYRPDLSADELEEILRLGATDLIDPLQAGDTLVGPDSISGWGYLNVTASYSLLDEGGLYLVDPQPRSRYTDDVAIRIAPVADYLGGWRLDYSVGIGSTDWQPLDSGLILPVDSIAHIFSSTDIAGFINLRLTDDNDRQRTVTFIYSGFNRLDIVAPTDGEQMQYAVPVFGSAFGPNYDSLRIEYRGIEPSANRLYTSSAEYFDSLIFTWNLSGIEAGDYTVLLRGYYGAEVRSDSVDVTILNSFAAGWPRQMPGKGAQSPVSADLDNDGVNELIVGTSYGLMVYNADGTLFSGFPALSGTDMRSMPAVYDVDRDGYDDIICTNADGLHVFNRFGEYVDGWPIECTTGQLQFGYPIPSVVQLGGSVPDTAIVLINNRGQILAFDLQGDSYFYSLDGWFADFGPSPSASFFYGGNSVASTDLNGDGLPELVATYSNNLPYAGNAILDARTGQTAWDMVSPLTMPARAVYGSVMADLNHDGLPEIITTGYTDNSSRTIWAKTLGVVDLPGWPIELPELGGWIGNIPTVADLDLDGSPEVLVTFFEFDIGGLFIYRADGTPYSQLSGQPYGEAFYYPATFGPPIVADLLNDEAPEIAIRGGYILPGTGTEKLFVLDNAASLIPGWPIATPNRPNTVFSTAYAPMVDDIDSDGLVELALFGDDNQLYVWDFTASSRAGRNSGRLFVDKLNSGLMPQDDIPTDVGDLPNALPLSFELQQNYPNPFNPSTVIEFALPEQAETRLDVFNVLGQRVTTLVDRTLPAGRHRVRFDGAGLASGVYLYRLKTDDRETSRKMMLVK